MNVKWFASFEDIYFKITNKDTLLSNYLLHNLALFFALVMTRYLWPLNRAMDFCKTSIFVIGVDIECWRAWHTPNCLNRKLSKQMSVTGANERLVTTEQQREIFITPPRTPLATLSNGYLIRAPSPPVQLREARGTFLYVWIIYRRFHMLVGPNEHYRGISTITHPRDILFKK